MSKHFRKCHADQDERFKQTQNNKNVRLSYHIDRTGYYVLANETYHAQKCRQIDINEKVITIRRGIGNLGIILIVKFSFEKLRCYPCKSGDNGQGPATPAFSSAASDIEMMSVEIGEAPSDVASLPQREEFFECEYCKSLYRRERWYLMHKEECDLAPGSRFRQIITGNAPQQNIPNAIELPVNSPHDQPIPLDIKSETLPLQEIVII